MANGISWEAAGRGAIAILAVIAMTGVGAGFTAKVTADTAQAGVVANNEKISTLRKAAYEEIQAIKEGDHKQDGEILTIKLSVEHIKEGVDKLVEKLLNKE